MRVEILAVVLFSVLATASLGASASASLVQYLNTYMPNSTISSYSMHNESVGANAYVIMQHGNSFIVVNATHGNYSMLMNATQIYKVLRPYALSAYAPSPSVLASLNTSMNTYETQAAPPLNDCLTETGLNQYTCTAANNCFSCQTVPICSHWLPYYGGPTGVMGLGIMNFSAKYNNLEANYSAFYKALHNASIDPYASITAMKSALSNISFIAVVMPQNPIFPVPTNFTASNFASCASYSIPTQEPWYCVDIGMCEYTTFNSTMLTSMQYAVQQLSLLPLSNASITQLSVNASNMAKAYVEPVVNAKETAAFDAFLNATMPKYNSTLANAQALLSRISNSTLSASVSRLEATFSAIKKLGINQSIALANTELIAGMSNVTALYSRLDALYEPLNSTARNASIAAIKYQLNFRNVPPALAKLSAEQQGISLELMQGVSSSSLQGMLANETAISKGISQFSQAPITMAALVKGIDGGAVSSMLYSANGPVISKIAAAPAYAALISFIIGIVIVLLIYSLTYARLRKRKKIKLNRRVRRSWGIVFLVLFILVLVYAYATFAWAQSANAFLPASMFTAKLHSSPSAAIIINSSGSFNSQQLLCAGALQKALQNEGKRVAVFASQNYSCTSTNSSFSGAQCFNKLLASGVPVIYMGSSAQSSIAYSGMYGYMLTADGNVTYGSACTLGNILK
ncbi:MAG: hypothetical protein M1360_00805 [Candidatus Marsarchaeota archaeon]|jgi:membrane protease YdiL (CAAX protease family)|nr:hypothetical protein [Candidatus Marsarchaeota archaeon]MCL5418466.1 hypothetical protein [Candidatus Marsarchaeota archaeon]